MASLMVTARGDFEDDDRRPVGDDEQQTVKITMQVVIMEIKNGSERLPIVMLCSFARYHDIQTAYCIR